jgi:hypothetical protein
MIGNLYLIRNARIQRLHHQLGAFVCFVAAVGFYARQPADTDTFRMKISFCRCDDAVIEDAAAAVDFHTMSQQATRGLHPGQADSPTQCTLSLLVQAYQIIPPTRSGAQKNVPAFSPELRFPLHGPANTVFRIHLQFRLFERNWPTFNIHQKNILSNKPAFSWVMMRLLSTNLTCKERRMTSQEKLQHDIETLKESIALNWTEIGAKPLTLTKNELQDIRDNIAWCTEEMRSLLAHINKLV